MSNNKNDKKKGRSVIGGVVLMFATLLLLFVMWIMSDPTNEPQLKSSLPEVRYEVKQKDIKKIYEKDLIPTIELANDRNEEARKRAIQTVREGFNRYRAGIPKFIEDLAGWGSKFTIISKMSQDMWNEYWNDEGSHESVQYIHEKFEEHIMASSEVDVLIKDSIVQFVNDLTANRNQMLVEMRIKLTADNVPVKVKLSESEWKLFLTNYEKQFDLKLESYGGDAVMYPILSLFAGECLYFGLKNMAQTTTRVVAPIMATFGTWLAGSIATGCASVSTFAGGSTVICSLGGGAGGSTTGPIGTAVGFIAGCAIGYVVDSFFEKRFEDKMTIELTIMLNQLEMLIINGHQDKRGLDDLYAEVNNKIKYLSQEASLHALYGREVN